MRSGNNFWSSTPWRTVFPVLVTLLAWTTAASWFIVLKLAPLTLGAPAIKYYVALGSLLPWLTGCKFWTMAGKRAKLGIADRDATGFCYGIILLTVGTAYGAMVLIETQLLGVLFRVH